MSNIGDKLLRLTKQLLPKGRSFFIGENSMKERVERALLVSEEQFVLDSLSILDSILPDNDNFTVYDAELWEQRLGLISNPLVSLADRKLAIIRKMNHPGDILARQSADYIQGQLQLAGFNVYVHENLNGQSPQSILILPLGINEMGSDAEMDANFEMGNAETYYSGLFIYNEMGDFEMGGTEMGEVIYSNMVANSVDELPDQSFDLGNSYLCTFIIGGQTFGTFADVDVNRKDEFRQLILKLKPAQTVGLLFINYV